MPNTKTASDIQAEINATQNQADDVQNQLAALATKSVKPSADLVAQELASAKLLEKSRVERIALRSAAEKLAAQKEALEKQLKEVERTEDRAKVEARTDEAIAKIEVLRPELESAVASVLAAMDKLKSVEIEYGSDVREHLNYIRVDDPNGQGKQIRDTLLDLKATIYLPKLVRKNGRDGSPLRYYGDLFDIEAEFVDMDKR